MSQFACRARRITLHPIEKADRLELARIEGTDYHVVCQKGLHTDGDLIVYIPEQAILPDSVIDELGLVSADGKTLLAGGTLLPDGTKKRNRVKALKLRGTLSQGLVYRYTEKLGPLTEGADYADALGITKWQPPIPDELLGKAAEAPELVGYTDIENIKNFPDVLESGEDVVATEKLHGVCGVFSLIDGELCVSGKGLAQKHLKLLDERDDAGNPTNAYWRAVAKYDLDEKVRALAGRHPGETVTLFGEVFGVQSGLKYGASSDDVGFRAFDIRVGDTFLDYDLFAAECVELGVDTCTVLYRGPFDRDAVEAAATGPETVTGKQAHHREGVVVKPTTERIDAHLGRVVLKVISPKYLNKQDDDATEYE